jgi:hypothetical protein
VSDQPRMSPKPLLKAEDVAYWYFRLNGFLLLENFYVHPDRGGGALTDADLLAVRFPHRAERVFDNPTDVMEDDDQTLALTRDRIDVVIAEIKTGRCALNGPWTDPGRRNMQRVLAAIGVVPQARIGEAAAALYEHGYFEADAALRVRLVAVGSRTDEDINTRYPRVSQVTWPDALRFIYRRLRRYRDQKSDTQHWNSAGHLLKRHVNRYSRSEDDFIAWATGAMTPAPSEGG